MKKKQHKKGKLIPVDKLLQLCLCLHCSQKKKKKNLQILRCVWSVQRRRRGVLELSERPRVSKVKKQQNEYTALSTACAQLQHSGHRVMDTVCEKQKV